MKVNNGLEESLADLRTVSILSNFLVMATVGGIDLHYSFPRICIFVDDV